MTQALLNNLITNNQQSFSDKLGTKDFTQSDFQNVLDKQTSLQTKADAVKDSIGAMKKITENTFQKLQDKIQETYQEVGSESALNLSLATADDTEITDSTIVTEDSAIDDEIDITGNNENNEIDTTFQNLVQPLMEQITKQVEQAADTVKNVAEKVISNVSETLEEELNVTINGIDLDKMLEDFGFNNTDDLPEIQPLKAENVEETEGKTLEELVDEDTLRELNIESVETDTSSGEEESSDLMQNQTAEEQGIKASLQQADVNFGELKTDSTQSNVSLQAAKPTGNSDVTPSKIIDQISKQMENMNTGSKVNIVLNPESLGKVSVQLINTKEGLSAQFTVATQDAKNLIMKGLDGLKDTLLAQGVNVDNVTVKLNETQNSEYNADWTEQEGSRGGNKEQGSRRGQKEKEQFEKMMSFAQNEEN